MRLGKSIDEEIKRKRGRKNTYTDFDKYHLIQLWKLSGHPCSKRLKSILEECLLGYQCSDLIKNNLKKMSPTQMHDYLRTARAEYLSPEAGQAKAMNNAILSRRTILLFESYLATLELNFQVTLI